MFEDLREGWRHCWSSCSCWTLVLSSKELDALSVISKSTERLPTVRPFAKQEGARPTYLK